MSQELKGRNGKIVGTNEYFKYLNKSFKFEDIVNIVNEYYYYESLKKLSKDSSSMITSVLYDVQKCSHVLPFISASCLLYTSFRICRKAFTPWRRSPHQTDIFLIHNIKKLNYPQVIVSLSLIHI